MNLIDNWRVGKKKTSSKLLLRHMIIKTNIISVITVLLLVVFLYGCRNPDDPDRLTSAFAGETNPESTNEAETGSTVWEDTPLDPFVCAEFVGRGFLTEKYALYHDDNSLLRLFDVVSKQDLVYCFDPGCEHEPAKRSITGDIIEEGCVAYDFSSYPVLIRGENCFFLREGEIVKSDHQGANRVTIGKIPAYIMTPDKVFYSKDSVYLTYSIGYEMTEVKNDDGDSRWIFGDLKDTDTCGLVRIDLSDGKVTEVIRFEEYDSMIFDYDIRGDHLYFDFFYADTPYVSANLETFGPSGKIPEGLTKENYPVEWPKHLWMDVYDYNMVTGELRLILKKKQVGAVEFCDSFFAFSEELGSVTELFRYDGEFIRKLDFAMGKGIRSDQHLVCNSADNRDVYMQIDENTGEIMRKTTIPITKVVPEVFVGESCYCTLSGEGNWGCGYISSEDFWNGEYKKAIPFQTEKN